MIVVGLISVVVIFMCSDPSTLTKQRKQCDHCNYFIFSWKWKMETRLMYFNNRREAATCEKRDQLRDGIFISGKRSRVKNVEISIF